MVFATHSIAAAYLPINTQQAQQHITNPAGPASPAGPAGPATPGPAYRLNVEVTIILVVCG